MLMLPSGVVVNGGLSIDHQAQYLGDIDIDANNRLVNAGNREASTRCLCEDVANLAVFWTALRWLVGCGCCLRLITDLDGQLHNTAAQGAHSKDCLVYSKNSCENLGKEQYIL